MTLKVRILRAAQAGNRPQNLDAGQVFIDEHQGVLAMRNPAGGIHEFNLSALANMATTGDITAAVGAVSFAALAGFESGAVAKLNAAAFTVSPTVPAIPAGDSSSKVASTAFVHSEVASSVAALVGGSPEDFDTLQEIFALAQSNTDARQALQTGQANKCEKSNNLSDLVDVAAARTNLGMGELATLDINDLVLDEGAI